MSNTLMTAPMKTGPREWQQRIGKIPVAVAKRDRVSTVDCHIAWR